MQLIQFRAILKAAVYGATVLLLAAGVGHAQQQVNLSAGPTTTTLPDGKSVPMWGYTCGAPVVGSTASCTALNPGAASASLWSPVIITVPTGQDLQINLTNNLSFTPVSSSSPNTIPTSIVIVGQVGGGLGGGGTSAASPVHDNQGATWPIANTGPAFTPPPQGARVQSFSTEVAAGATTSLKWPTPSAGTYLLESGTHPSIQATMGLIGMVVVTTAPSTGQGTAYPGVSYSGEVPLIFSEIDPRQNLAVASAVTTVGFNETAVHGNFGGPVTSVVVTNGGKNYTAAPTVNFSTGAPSAHATAQIDTSPGSPTLGQVIAITVDTPGVYASAATVTFTNDPSDITGTGAAAIAVQRSATTLVCSGGAAACYPPVVNYSPLYYLINGVAFDKTNAPASVFAATEGTNTAAITGNVLVRMVNAGSRMHVPTVVGSSSGGSGGFALIAEDGNPLPGKPRLQNEVFMAAGKTYDVMVDTPVGGVSAVTVGGGGSGYTSPVVTFSGGGGGGASAKATVTGGVITAIAVTNPGSGYTSAPTVTITDAGATSAASATATVSPGFGTLPVFDRQLSLSANGINHDAGMLAYISFNGAAIGASPSMGSAQANPDAYSIVLPCAALPCAPASVADPSKGLIANDINIFGVKVTVPPTLGAINLNTDGTFTFTPNPGWTTSSTDTFTYCGNGATANSVSSHPCEVVTLSGEALENAGNITCSVPGYTATLATSLKISAPGVLAYCTDSAGFPLTATNVTGVSSNLHLALDANGSFKASATGSGMYSFTFSPKNSQGVVGAPVQVNITFPPGSGLVVSVVDGSDKTTQITDYRWVIEEDRTFFVDPNCAQNPLPSGCPGAGSGVVPAFGTNFHTSFMPLIATGCTGTESCAASQTVLGTQVEQPAFSSPGDIALCGSVPANTPCLDPQKRYYISVLPGDAAQPFIAGYAGAPDCTGASGGVCGHGMGGATIPKGAHDSSQSILVLTEPSPYPPATLSVFVFEDDFPLNGEHDAGGGIDILSPNEPGLGGFQITLQDDAGGTGDATGTPTYDMFNMPLSNSLAGTIDPVTHEDACPLSGQATDNAKGGDGTQKGIVGMIVTCPTYESDGTTLSPLAGQAVVKNLYQGRYGVVAMPGADRIARGEEWLQTNTLDGQKAHDSFMRIGEPAYFQEFGPAGYHVTIGYANPKIINDRGAALCASGADCAHEVKGHVTTARMSRTPDERLYGSGTHDSYSFTQCYVSIGDPDGAEFGLTKCDDGGNFDFPNVPAGNWKITTFDQWNDQVVDGISTPIGMCDPQSSLSGNPPTNCKPLVDLGEVAVHQWQANIYTRTFLDLNGDGISNVDGSGNATEPGLPLAATNIRFRDGSFSNFNNTDLNGYAGFNEVFPLFNWYVIETDSTRFKNTGAHVVYDSGGPVDGSSPNGVSCATGTNTKFCGTSNIGANLANTYEPHPLPGDLHVPGAVYCTDADCTGQSILDGPNPTATPTSTGRIDPPWVTSYGWQGYSGQNNFIEFGKKPFAEGENGGIHGHVVYASTRPFDDPQLLLQLSWEPLVPHVRVNLYKEDVAADGITQTLTLVDHTDTTSFDDWAQGFRSDGKPNMSCPGQGDDNLSDPLADPYFFFALKDQPQWLDTYNNGGTPTHTMPYNSRYKCYDGMHNWNQLQPAPYDGMYSFPSVTSMDPVSGKPLSTNCTACIANPTIATGDPTDPKFDKYRAGTPMLPDGKYVVEVVVPPGYELVKEEDKNILIGDNFIAPVTQQFGGLASIFILPDQAEIAEAYNANNSLNATDSLGRNSNLPSHEGDTGSDESFWPCVGEERVVPDFISLFPDSQEVSPFAGATRHLCDRKEVALTDQTTALAKFYIFTETHTASHYSGVITDDFSAEFDPYSPQFGEKFAPAYLPISFRDWTGNEITRVYSDAWGAYNGLNYSTWEVNPPNPTGYGPNVMVGCMNDPEMPDPNHPGQLITDPMYQAGYSDFCYELPFMPGQTGYFDTPVVPTSAFAGGYNAPDCSYPDATPAILRATGQDGIAGPWVSAPGHQLVITALGDQSVDNYAYSGPQTTTPPFNQQKVKRHYGFGTAPTDFSKFAAPPSGYHYSCSSSASTDLCPYVTIGGQAMSAVSWSDTSIAGSAPSGVPDCAVQQQAQYGGSHAQCGELVVTAANGKQSVDAVTITIGGKMPTVVSAGQTIQSVIDAAAPGDMIIVPPGTFTEMLLMWKPLRLQGVGAASSVIDANPHPAGRLDPWRREVVCLFGLALNGQPYTPGSSSSNPFDSSGTFSCPGTLNYFSGGPNFPTMVVDRIPMEGILGWDTTVNGNLAEQLIEPSLMGAYEGAGITVLGKGVNIPAGATDVWGSGAEAAFPAGSVPLTSQDCATGPSGANLYPSNFLCNPSSIDGLTVKNSSQGGGGILVHGWAHDLQIANNRVLNNQGTLSGGITIGQGEHPDVPLVGGGTTTIPPGSCIPDPGSPANLALPYCYDLNVNIHNNKVVQNSSLGDELFTSTPAGAGGVTICNGSDYYKFNYNWVCGNMSTGDGGGIAQIGFSYDGGIEHNSIIFNQSTNPSIPTNGGGLLVMGAPDPDPPCATNDQDCVSPPNSVTPSDGVGPGLVINGNLIQGNSADSGSGGGLRMQDVNGTDVLNFPNAKVNVNGAGNPTTQIWPDVPGHTENADAFANPHSPRRSQALTRWNAVSITNNIIANNVAGLDGGGLSLQNSLATDVINNTVVSNDSTATSGELFGSLFAPLASSQGTSCTVNSGSGSCPQVAGLVSITNGEVLTANIALLPGGPSSIVCPTGHGAYNTTADCTRYSVPAIYNDVFWRNRAFMIGVGGLGGNLGNQQNVVSVEDPHFSSAGIAPVLTTSAQTFTGSCDTSANNFWDIGIRGDNRPGDHSSGGILSPQYSVLTNDGGAAPSENGNGSNNILNPAITVTNSYCNGSRTPPESGGVGWEVPPGTNESNALPAPPFTLLPAATVDEGNNWINLRWGPLSMSNPSTGAILSNPTLAAGSSAIDYVPIASAQGKAAPVTDFFGNPRPDPFDPNRFDVGAIELQLTAPTITSISPNTGVRGYSVNVTFTGKGFNSGTPVILRGPGTFTATNIVVVSDTQVTATLNIAKTAALGANSIGLRVGTIFTNTLPFTVTNPPTPVLTAISPAIGLRSTTVSTTVAVTLTGTSLLTTSAITVSPVSGVTVSALTPVNDTTVTANFVISTSAALSARTVTVTTLGGTSNTVTFTVAQPTLSSISPSSGAQGSSVPVTLTGTNLTGATGLTGLVNGVSLAAGTFHAVNSTTITATLTISASATVGARSIGAVTPSGNTNTVSFTVTLPAPPTLTSINPSSALRGGAVNVTLTGTNFTTAGTGSTIFPPLTGITVTNLVVVNSTTITATFTTAATASLGPRNVSVRTPGGTSGTVTYTITGPTISSITPNSGTKPSTVPVTISGTGLTGTTAIAAGTGVTASNIVVVNDHTVTANFVISAAATTGGHSVTLTSAAGASTAGTFTVNNPPVATVTSISPTSGFRGTTIPVTLTGTSFTQGSTVAAGSGITVGTVNVVNSTQITTTFTIGTGASSLGAHSVTVTNATGTASGPVTFSMLAPTLTSINPTSASRGTAVNVTLTGTNFAPTGTTISAGNGITVTNLVVVNSTTITATFSTPSNAGMNTRSVSVTTPNGTTGTVGYTIHN
jgi:IPT/TIG domain